MFLIKIACVTRTKHILFVFQSVPHHSTHLPLSLPRFHASFITYTIFSYVRKQKRNQWVNRVQYWVIAMTIVRKRNKARTNGGGGHNDPTHKPTNIHILFYRSSNFCPKLIQNRSHIHTKEFKMIPNRSVTFRILKNTQSYTNIKLLSISLTKTQRHIILHIGWTLES